MTKNWKKFTAENFLYIFFGSKNAIYLSLDLHKGRPSYRRSLQPSKENNQPLQNMKYLNFLYFCGSQPSCIQIRIHWPDSIRIQSGFNPDPIQIQSGSNPDPEHWSGLIRIRFSKNEQVSVPGRVPHGRWPPGSDSSSAPLWASASDPPPDSAGCDTAIISDFLIPL